MQKCWLLGSWYETPNSSSIDPVFFKLKKNSKAYNLVHKTFVSVSSTLHSSVALELRQLECEQYWKSNTQHFLFHFFLVLTNLRLGMRSSLQSLLEPYRAIVTTKSSILIKINFIHHFINKNSSQHGKTSGLQDLNI